MITNVLFANQQIHYLIFLVTTISNIDVPFYVTIA